LGLRVTDRAVTTPGALPLASALSNNGNADVILLTSHIDPAGRRALFRAASAVLANSRHEPFGLVGLEAMAAGGLACTGCSGEDYAVPGQNALVLERDDPMEFVHLFERLPIANQVALRKAGRKTALQYAWPRVIGRVLLARVDACARLAATPVKNAKLVHPQHATFSRESKQPSLGIEL
jgi:glycosyltransferase involved in cell wall biosynthesis